jgi:hypothetical protein
MGFVNPALLFLGLVAAVPILLHLLQRQQGPRVIFPALRYLRRAERESARKVRLRQLLLMLLRAGAIVLLALAAARPFTRAAGGAHLPTAVAIVLDNSMSSGAVIGDVRVLDELKARALEVLAVASPEDRFWLIRAGAPWEPALVGGAEETAARVRATEPVATLAELPASVAHARTLLAAGAEGRAREIHVLSDLQRTALAGTAGAAGDEPVLVWAPPRAPPPNAAVAQVEIGGGLAPTAGERATVVAPIVGDGIDTVGVRLVVQGRTVAAATARPGEAAVLTLPAQPAGLAIGHVEIDADALRTDDRRHFAVRISPPPAVAASETMDFVASAVAVMAGAGRLHAAAPADADVVIVDGGVGGERVAPGRAVFFVPPDDPLLLPAANRRLGELGVPWRLEPAPPGGELRFAEPGVDPLLRPLEQARVHGHYLLRREGGTAAADSVVLSLADGQPWAVIGERQGGGRFAIVASSLDERATTIPTSPALVPLLDRALGTWLAGAALAGEARPGDEVALAVAADSVRAPDGIVQPLQQARSYRVGGEPGIHAFFAADSIVHAVAVNPPTAASELLRADRRLVRDRIGGEVRFAGSERDWRREIFHARLGSELWRPLLLLALLLLVAEALVAASGRRRRPEPVVAAS